MTINERFSEILNRKNISIKEASGIIGKSEGYVRKLLIPNQSFGIEPVKVILNSIKDVDINWLLTGEGEMFKTDTSKIEASTNNDSLITYLKEENQRLTKEVVRLELLLEQNGIDHSRKVG